MALSQQLVKLRWLVGSFTAAGLLVSCTAGQPPPTATSATSSATSAVPSSATTPSPASAPLTPPSPTAPTTSPSMSAAARKYLDAALNLMQRRAVNRARLDWPAIRQQALDIAAGAVITSDTYTAIASAVEKLDVNGHSRFVSPPVGPNVPSGPLGPSQLPSGKLLPGRIGYIALPGVDEQHADQYQAAGAAMMRSVLGGHPDGWILDLRSDDGGDVWPMLGGIQPLLAVRDDRLVRFAA